MVDAYRLRSPLAHLGLEARAADENDISGTGVVLSEIPYRGLINIRGDARDKAFTDGVKAATKLDLPLAPNTISGKSSGTHIMWLGPDEWMVITKPGGAAKQLAALAKALKDGKLHASVTDSSEARTCIRVAGLSARDVLAKGCALDLHPNQFTTGECAQTIVAKAGVMLVQTADRKVNGPIYELYVLRSFANYLWAWLDDAAQEYGVKVE